ncbi:MAG: tRNA (N(6)-L-threonylcarbamoyladenosine(37)-C(2))-methylthiotransferase MtaB [bacterium]
MAFATLGCKVNQSETEAMKDLFQERGYQVVDFGDSADVYVINTCTVTHLADRKSRQLVRRASRRSPAALIAVVGCWAQTAPAAVEELPEVDVIVGTRDRGRIVDYVEEAASGKQRVNRVQKLDAAINFEELPLDYSTRTRAYLKIQDGCDQFCTYCIIPYARGPVRSRVPERVRAAAESLVTSGYKEIVLTGIHLGLYGRDLEPGTSLLTVLRLLEDLPGLERVRLSSLDPAEVTPEILDHLASSERTCHHLHIPLQSGSDAVLKRMGRPYTAGEYLDLVRAVRDRLPRAGITTDIIVGFPGETEAEFQETLTVVREAGFSRLHVFTYSPRQGTPAAEYPNQVKPQVKEERSHRLISLGKELAMVFHASYLEQELMVLVEEEREGGKLAGYSDNYIRVRFNGPDELMNHVLPVRVLAATSEYVEGEVAKTSPPLITA